MDDVLTTICLCGEGAGFLGCGLREGFGETAGAGRLDVCCCSGSRKDGMTYSVFSCSQGLGPPELFSVPDQPFEKLLVSGSSWETGAMFTGTCVTGGGRGLC